MINKNVKTIILWENISIRCILSSNKFIVFFKKYNESGFVAHTCNPPALRTEAGELGV